MSDDKTNARSQDRARINIHEDYELRRWSESLGVSKEKLQDAVAKVGPMVADVKRALHGSLKDASFRQH